MRHVDVQYCDRRLDDASYLGARMIGLQTSVRKVEFDPLDRHAGLVSHIHKRFLGWFVLRSVVGNLAWSEEAQRSGEKTDVESSSSWRARDVLNTLWWAASFDLNDLFHGIRNWR